MASQEVLTALGFSLADGIYILKEDVKNPMADKRFKRAFDAVEVWHKGMLVSVKCHLKDEKRMPRICQEGEPFGILVASDYNRVQWEALVSGLEPAPRIIGVALAELRLLNCIDRPSALLGWMLNTGVVNYNQIIQAGKDLTDNVPDEKFLKWLKDNGIGSY